MEWIERFERFFFGFSLSGVVLAFVILPSLKSLAGNPRLDPVTVAFLAIVGPVVGLYVLGFLWSMMAEMAWDMLLQLPQGRMIAWWDVLPSFLKDIFTPFTLIGLVLEAVVVFGVIVLISFETLSATGQGQAIALSSTFALILLLVAALMAPLIFWLGYIQFPINLLSQIGSARPSASTATGIEEGRGRVRKVLDEYGSSARPPGDPEALRPGEGLLDRARRTQRHS